MAKKSKIEISDEEWERRKELNLPVTKQLRFMKHLIDRYQEFDVIDYEIVDTYMPSGIHSLLVTLDNGEQIRILAPFFAEMQKPSFVEDMERANTKVEN